MIIPPTAALIAALGNPPTRRRLCGWESPGDLPKEPTFRHAFATFAHDALPQRLQETKVKIPRREQRGTGFQPVSIFLRSAAADS